MSKLLWIDLEMTGLDPELDSIIEVAAIVTDYEFKEYDRFESVIKFDVEAIERMKQGRWIEEENGEKVLKGTVYDMAVQSGLVERNQSQGRELSDVMSDFLAFLDKNFDQDIILAGNSIHTDRRFIKKHWPKVEEKLHYRMLDVTSLKLIALNKYSLEYQSGKTHRALDDIEDSIAELKFYLKEFSRVEQ